MCPELKEELNCTQECSSDGECADNLKCCRAGCAALCLLPNGNSGWPGAGRGEEAGAAGFQEGGRSGTRGPLAKPRRMEPDRPALVPLDPGGTKAASLRRDARRGAPPLLPVFQSLVRDGLPGTHSRDVVQSWLASWFHGPGRSSLQGLPDDSPGRKQSDRSRKENVLAQLTSPALASAAGIARGFTFCSPGLKEVGTRP